MVSFAPLADSATGLALILLLGLRHGLDPDHVAVIDNLTFKASEDRARFAPLIGSLFALGHSLSVSVIAVGASLIGSHLRWPTWAGEAVDWAAIALLFVVGAANLKRLLSAAAYVPAGWRQGLVPRALRDTSHPVAVVAIGVIFGLVFDTATQAATWGLAAASRNGVAGAVAVSAVFAAGMIATDTADSFIVARLLRDGRDASRARRYRRGVGWLIVGLSFGMGAYALATRSAGVEDLSAALFTLLGIVMALTVAALLLFPRSGQVALPPVP